MRQQFFLAFSFLLLLLYISAVNAQEIVKEWSFNKDGQRKEWTGANHIKNVTVKNGVLAGRNRFIYVCRVHGIDSSFNRPVL